MSECRWISTLCSPALRIGPWGMRTSLRSTFTPDAVRASAMSMVPTEPNSLPSWPALALMVTVLPSSSALRFSAPDSISAACFSSSARRFSNSSMFLAVAGLALGDQVVAAVAGTHLDLVAQATQVLDLLQEDDFHF